MYQSFWIISRIWLWFRIYQRQNKCCNWYTVFGSVSTFGKWNIIHQVLFDRWDQTHYANDNKFESQFENLFKESKSIEEIRQFESYYLRKNILYFDARVCILYVGDYRLDVMHDLYDIPIGVHPSFQKTYMTIKHHYNWPSITRGTRT